MSLKKLLVYVTTIVTAVILATVSASACTMIYVGSDYTDDGATYLARSEDYSNSYNKIAYISEHGKHPAGSTYEGCYGFTHTFTHDSYSYTATADDFLGGSCPDCGQKHAHTPMEECGTNEKGVSVSAMVTLSWNSKLKAADPMVSGGMCESDMTTVLLGEAATAKEGVYLLMKIYDTIGAEERSGVLIADQNEAWYVENYTGHQYIAVKLSSGMIAISPNMGAIGLVDLDDTANVMASKDIINAAKAAGTYVGDEEANTIDFRASYSATSINARMINGLNYLLGEEKFASGNISSADFTISNVKDGKIVPMYTPIETNRTITTKDMVDFYKVSGIGNTSNLEWHIFQVRPTGAMETATIEWLAMENGQYTVAIPYYPVLTTEMYEGYTVGGIGKIAFAAELPEGATGYFPYTNRGTEGYRVLPTGWEKGYYWTVDALSNYALSSACTAEENEWIHANIAVMQQKCYDKIAEMEGKIGSMDAAAAKAYATEQSAALAEEAHALTLALYTHLTTDECTFDDGKVTVPPTATTDGELTYTCIYCGATETVSIPATPFTDVDYNAYYAIPAVWAYQNQVVAGTTATTFSPEAACTRAQFITMLWRVAGSPKASAGAVMPFADVKEGSYYYDAVLWAVENGITAGVDATHFAPNGEVTRAQVVTFLYQVAGCPAAEGENPFTDVEDGRWYTKPVIWAANNGIVAGMGDGVFAPDTVCNRAMIVTMFCAFL